MEAFARRRNAPLVQQLHGEAVERHVERNDGVVDRGERGAAWEERLRGEFDPEHRYRLTGEYDNPLDRPIRFGGMASVVGLAVPDRGTAWPRVDRTDPIYRAQLHNLLANMAGVAMEHDGHGMR
jgi:hypothetical protein